MDDVEIKVQEMLESFLIVQFYLFWMRKHIFHDFSGGKM